jgi:site-specific recombinase XerD
VNDHGIRDITLRHDLHALSKFFGYAVKQRWAVDNPVRNVTIPSDADAIRIHLLTTEEEREYFVRAAKHRDLNDLGRLMLNQGMRPEEATSLRPQFDSPSAALRSSNGRAQAKCDAPV